MGEGGGGGGGQTHLNCYTCPLGVLTVNNRMQSVINLIYVPRHKKIQAVVYNDQSHSSYV